MMTIRNGIHRALCGTNQTFSYLQVERRLRAHCKEKGVYEKIVGMIWKPLSKFDTGPVVPNMTYVMVPGEQDEEVAVKVYRRTRKGLESVVGLIPELTLFLKTFRGEVVDVREAVN